MLVSRVFRHIEAIGALVFLTPWPCFFGPPPCFFDILDLLSGPPWNSLNSFGWLLFFVFSRQVLFFFWVPGSMLSCFCLSAVLLLCFSAFCFCCFFSAFLLFAFPASLLFILLCFTCFFSFLLLCFLCFSAFLLLCFCAFLLLLLLFYLFFLQSCVFAALLPAPLLLCFLSLMPLCFFPTSISDAWVLV